MIGGVIYAALRALVNDRCYPSTFPQPAVMPQWPAIRYTIAGNNEPTICGTDTTATDDTRVAIDVVAYTYGAMVTLRDQVIVALQSADPPCYRDGDFIELVDSDTKTHRCILQFQFFASSP